MAADSPRPATARLLVILGAASFSTGGTAIKATAFSGMQAAALRSGVAALCILLFLPGSRTIGTWRTWLVGSGYAATMILFVVANKLTLAANATFLQSTAPLFVLLASPLVLREPVRRRDLGFLAVMGLGLGLFFVGEERPIDTAPEPLLGNVLALISAVGWAGTILGIRWLKRDPAGPPTEAAVLLGNVLAFLAGAPALLALGATSPADWALIAYLGAFQVSLSYALLAAGLKHVRALEASLLLLAEPVLASLWAFLFHGEAPGPWSLAGGAIVLAATAWQAARGGTR